MVLIEEPHSDIVRSHPMHRGIGCSGSALLRLCSKTRSWADHDPWTPGVVSKARQVPLQCLERWCLAKRPRLLDRLPSSQHDQARSAAGETTLSTDSNPDIESGYSASGRFEPTGPVHMLPPIRRAMARGLLATAHRTEWPGYSLLFTLLNRICRLIDRSRRAQDVDNARPHHDRSLARKPTTRDLNEQ